MEKGWRLLYAEWQRSYGSWYKVVPNMGNRVRFQSSPRAPCPELETLRRETIHTAGGTFILLQTARGECSLVSDPFVPSCELFVLPNTSGTRRRSVVCIARVQWSREYRPLLLLRFGISIIQTDTPLPRSLDQWRIQTCVYDLDKNRNVKKKRTPLKQFVLLRLGKLKVTRFYTCFHLLRNI